MEAHFRAAAGIGGEFAPAGEVEEKRAAVEFREEPGKRLAETMGRETVAARPLIRTVAQRRVWPVMTSVIGALALRPGMGRDQRRLPSRCVSIARWSIAPR